MAVCGNDCPSCPRFLATQSGDSVQLTRVTELWRRVGFRDSIVSVDEIKCGGCPPSRPCRYNIAKCAQSKGFATCGACGDLNDCARISSALKRTAEYAASCKPKCSAAEYEALDRAFFRKRENLGKKD